MDLQKLYLFSHHSKADKILAKAVEIERRQANSEMEKVRESMKSVLERERMLMRGRLADNLNSNRFRQDESNRNNPYIESKRSAMNYDRSNAEEDENTDSFEEEESIWSRRQGSLH